MFRSFDLWYKYFKKLVTATSPNPDDLDVSDNIFIQPDWEEHFGSSLRVYENKHPFPGLLINYEDGFIRLIQLTSHNQISQFPQIIQKAVSQINSPFVSIRCWSTLPNWERDNWINVQPSKHLALINGFTYQGQWYEGETYLSFRDPYALTKCWRNYFNNQILDVIQDLWKDYHFIGCTERIHVFGIKPYVSAVRHLERTGHDDSRKFLIPRKSLVYETLLYYGFCSQYAIYHEHEHQDNPPWEPYNPWDPYDGYPSDAYDTD
ncbi:hypothetical protein SO802_006393 [Lithocarpus litseifolius]|uniref:Uncharacterized protein n=1 Tax=Lithocarpus litseifolius TaxID=425828 RepID=A0AAW2DPQ1_9ROSI